jgi:hypothetical protein
MKIWPLLWCPSSPESASSRVCTDTPVAENKSWSLNDSIQRYQEYRISFRMLGILSYFPICIDSLIELFVLDQNFRWWRQQKASHDTKID